MRYPIEIDTYADGHIAVNMTLADYTVLNSRVFRSVGQSLSEVADENPAEAYGLFKRVLGIMAASHCCSITINEEPPEDYGEIDLSESAKALVQDRLPNEHYEEVDLSVEVFSSVEDGLLFGSDFDRTTPVCAIQITPERLAS
jgi:hypothetical protein